MRIGEQQHFPPLLSPFTASPLPPGARIAEARFRRIKAPTAVPPPGHESRRFDVSTSPHDVETFFSRVSRAEGREVRESRRGSGPCRNHPWKPVEPGSEERATRVETTPRSWLSRAARNERPVSKPPGSQKAHPPRLPGHGHHGFDTANSQSEQTGSTNFREGSSGNSSISCLSPWARITEVRRFNVATRRRTVFLPCFAHEEGSHSRPALPTVLVSSCSTRTWRRGRGSATSAILLGDEHLPVRRSSVRIRDCPATVRWARGPRVRSPCPVRH